MLLTIPASIPLSFNVYPSGVDAHPNYVPLEGVGIFSTSGGINRISYANDTSPRSDGGVLGTFSTQGDPFAGPLRTDLNYYRADWSSGATSAGAAGSPLIDALTDRVVGVLSNAASSCDGSVCSQPGVNCTTEFGYAYHGRIASAWTRGLKDVLQVRPAQSAAQTPVSGTALLEDDSDFARAASYNVRRTLLQATYNSTLYELMSEDNSIYFDDFTTYGRVFVAELGIIPFPIRLVINRALG
jgi:hypothetical protein